MTIKQEQRVKELQSLASQGLSQVEIASKLGVSESRISQLFKKHSIVSVSKEELFLESVKHIEFRTAKQADAYTGWQRELLIKTFNLPKTMSDVDANPLFNRKKTNRLYNRFSDMKYRCYNENCAIFKYYGGKGVEICDEWLNGNEYWDGFDCFAIWAIHNGYVDGVQHQMQIDRIDNNGSYSPDNCRWVDATENMNNRDKVVAVRKRDNKVIVENGNYYTVKEYALLKGIKEKSVRTYIYFGKLETVRI